MCRKENNICIDKFESFFPLSRNPYIEETYCLIPDVCENGTPEKKKSHHDFGESKHRKQQVEKCQSCDRGFELENYTKNELTGTKCVKTNCTCENSAFQDSHLEHRLC